MKHPHTNVAFDFFGPLYVIWTCFCLAIGYAFVRRFQRQYEKIETHLVSERHKALMMKDQDTEENEEEPLISNVNEGLRNAIASRAMDISFENLGLTGKNKARFLQGVTGSVNSGELLLVMGPSGCGKSTFLHTLAGRAHYGNSEGRVFVNGVQVQNMQSFKEQIGFVPQEDIMHRILNVKEILQFAAEMREQARDKNDNTELTVEQILEMLGLSHVRFSIIGDENTRGISGGQRKRVNLGIELVANPMLLFLDEPTSGLDSSSSKAICENLRQLCAMGLTVIAVLHQPRWEIFEMFNKVLLLAKGGKTVYFGPTKEVEQYFEEVGFPCPQKVNPPDFFLDVISGDLDKSFDPAVLTSKWEVRQEEILKNAHQVQLEESGASTRYQILSASFESILKDIRTPTHFGVLNIRFWIACLVGAVFPLFGIFTYAILNGTEVNEFYAALIVHLLYVSVGFSVGTIGINDGRSFNIFIGIMVPIAIASFFYVIFRCRRNQPINFATGVIAGFFLGPVGFLATFYHSFALPKEKSSIRFGCFLLATFATAYWWIAYTIEGVSMTPESGGLCVIVAAFSIAGLITIHHHHSRLPHVDHQTTSFLRQVWMFFVRGCTQQLRDWKGIVFDLGLVIVASVFLGVIFYQQQWEGPILNPFGVQSGCPSAVKALLPQMCLFLSIPLFDPFPGQASLSILALALCAVASSLRLYGAEKAQFIRETSSGMNSEAYYLGKTLSHLPIVLLAPFLFFMSFYTMAVIKASFWSHYLLLLLIYFCASGASYCVSILIKPSSAQLVGILVVLSNMTFSGANPTLVQLSQNLLIPKYLIYPTYLSFIRWGQELHYLLEIVNYNEAAAQGYSAMEEIYGYYLSDYTACWIWLIVHGIVYRLVAYVALVKQEE